MDMISGVENYWRTFFEGSPEGVMLLGAIRASDGTIEDFAWLDANARALEILGADPDELIGSRFLHRFPRQKGVFTRYLSALESGRTLEFERQMPAPARRESDSNRHPAAWYAVTVIPGSDDHAIVLLRSIGEYKTVLKEAVDMMHQDDLTGVANRRYLKSRFWVLRGKRPRFGILFFDLDGFKEVNDTHGHEVGDKVLRLVARRLQQNVRPEELVARIGGDEFAVLVSGADPDSVASLVERLLAELGEPMHIGDLVISLGSSAGVAFYPDDGDSFDAVLRCADGRMYRHKRGGDA